MNKKRFYEEHWNFSCRTILEYNISPGIKCKFDTLKEYIGNKAEFSNGIDLGCSGNSFLYFLKQKIHKSFFDLASLPLEQYSNNDLWHPVCGDLINLPYRDKSFDLVSALDVLEHIRAHENAISEISRILRRKGICIITVPHRKIYYTPQDSLIGHYRRYEIEEIHSLFRRYNLVNIRTFGIYGRLMKIADVQSTNPQKTEKSIESLRKRYAADAAFRKIWDFAIKISSNVMKLEAKYCPIEKIMNIGAIFIKY